MYLHKFNLVVADADFTAPTIINNGIVFHLTKNGTSVASYVKGFISGHDTVNNQTWIYGESFSDSAITVALGDVIAAEIKTIPSIGPQESCTTGYVTLADCTVSNFAVSQSGAATTADVNAAGNAIIELLNGTTPLV